MRGTLLRARQPLRSSRAMNVSMCWINVHPAFPPPRRTSLVGPRGGGVQVDYTDKGTLKSVEQRFYGETGSAYARFYYGDEGRVFAITKLNLTYDVPIYVDPAAKIGASEKKDFYLSRDGTICRWFLNDVEQAVDKDTTDMI